MATIDQLKQQDVTETPLFLFECKLTSGTVERWSTHAVSFNGNDYRARVIKHNLFELKASSDDGLDSVSRISLTLANADSYFSQIERSIKWKGGILSVRFLFYDLKNSVAASEDRIVFRGIANAPDEITESTLRLFFTNRLNLQRILLPEVRLQKRCPWIFPSTATDREEALSGTAKGTFSGLYRCGYSADVTGGIGNSISGTPYTSCDYTRTQCEQRGMFDTDEAGRASRRFGGLEFVPASVLIRGYGEKGSHLSPVVDNQARYNDFIPLLYGTAWYAPQIVFARNDGNMTRMEILLGMGPIQGVVKAIVNNIEIPEGQAGANMTATGWFNVIKHGDREGAFNPDFSDSTGHPLGDPYGSMAMMSLVVPNRISDGQSAPRVRILAEGLKVGRYDSAGVLTDTSFSNNPAWVLFDLFRRSGWGVAELDVPSFASTAAYCDQPVTMTDLNGNPALRPRYQCNLVLQKRRSAADVIRGVRNASALYLGYGVTGLLQLRSESSLADQQADKASGSNSTETLGGGWPAYEFSDGSANFSGITRKESGEPNLRLFSRNSADTPNLYTVEFQDEFNEYQQDSLSLEDIDDAQLLGQEISAPLTALAIPNFDQATRIARLALSKSIQGNTYVEFETSVRGVGLSPGDIITMTYLKEGLERQPLRVVKLAPGLNYRTILITAQWHEDVWYDASATTSNGGRRQGESGVGLPRPLVGDAVSDTGDTEFSIQESAVQSADGSFLVALRAGFVPPAKPGASGAGVPILSLSSQVSNTGGAIKGGQTYYYALSARDTTGAESVLSFAVKATIPAGSDANAVTLTGLSFTPGTMSFNVYRGASPAQVSQIASAVAVAATFTDVGGATGMTIGPPDPNFDHANFYWRLELQPESNVDVYSSNSLGDSTLHMLANELRGSTVRITRGMGAKQERTILANTLTTITVLPAWDISPDPTSHFTVSESSWHFGGLGSTSPVDFDIPNRQSSTVQISGRSANVHDKECAYELSPLTRWRIGGAGLTALDADVPAIPIFGLYTNGQGIVELLGLGFTDLTNTRTVIAGTLTLFYWDELGITPNAVLTEEMASSASTLALTVPGSAAPGDLIQVESEVMGVVSSSADGLQYTVVRASHGSAAASHDAGVVVYPLTRKILIMPFIKDFFGSLSSGSYSFATALSDARIAAAEFFVTNTRGNSDPARVALTATLDAGLRTLSGGQLSIQIEGFLAAQANAAPSVVVENPHAVRDIFATVQEAPTGGSVQLEVLVGGIHYCALTIQPGATTSNVVPGFGLPVLATKSQLTLNVTSVPVGDGTLPGRALTVTVRL